MPTPFELSVIAPTLNERENIAPLFHALEAALQGLAWELIVVDDNSSDGTAAYVKELAQTQGRLRCIRRIGRRGLASAAIEGFLASSALYLALIDADMQHDETLLPRMLEKLKQGGCDIVVASRYMQGGGAQGLACEQRALFSRIGNRLARLVLQSDISDPMSGFFMLRRDVFEKLAPQLSGQGFKILVDILASSHAPLKVAELPYEFRTRHAGISKFDGAVKLDFLLLLLDKTLGSILPPRFILFSAVGAFGVLVHLLVLSALHYGTEASFAFAQAFAAFAAMTVNFFLNNAITYRDRRLKGFGLLKGLVSFYVVCSIGLFANVGVAVAFFGAQQWWTAGILGALVGTVWNYAASNALTWKGHR